VIDFKVLILDDDEKWLALHERRLSKAGIDYVSTQSGQEAIKIARTDPAVKFALIDEILYVCPYPLEEEERELQRWQGSGVIREITSHRSDIQFIMVTAAVQIDVERQAGDVHVFRRETARLRRQPGIVDVVHKVDIEEKPEETYQWLLDLVKQPIAGSQAQVVTPKVLIGLGFSIQALEAVAEQAEVKRRKFMPIELLLRKVESNPARFLDQLFKGAEEQRIYLEMPGSKTLDLAKGIQSDSSAFQILSFLAKQSMLGQAISIANEDYAYKPRRSSHGSVVDEAVDQIERQAFAYDYSDQGRQVRHGVQIERVKSTPTSRLKVAISRLSKHLQKLNVCPSRQAFIHEQGCYTPSFELGIVLYAVNLTKSTKRTNQ
jgi:CheY-like chemotaxis protein